MYFCAFAIYEVQMYFFFSDNAFNSHDCEMSKTEYQKNTNQPTPGHQDFPGRLHASNAWVRALAGKTKSPQVVWHKKKSKSLFFFF